MGRVRKEEPATAAGHKGRHLHKRKAGVVTLAAR